MNQLVSATACPRCAHLDHISLCGVFYEMQGVEAMCDCLTPTVSSVDLRHLRRQDAQSERGLAALQKEQRTLRS